MTALRAILSIALILVPTLSMHPAAAREAVEVRVKVASMDDGPLDRVLVCLAVNGDRLVDAVTDVRGYATLEADVDAPTICIEHAFAKPGSTLDRSAQLAATERLAELFGTYYFEPKHVIDLEPGRQRYEIAVTAWPAINVTATIVDEEGRPQRGDLMGPPHSVPGIGRTGMPVRLRSIRRGADTLICASTYAAWPMMRIKPLELSARQTQSDVDLGRIAIPTSESGPTIDLVLTGESRLHERSLASAVSGVTLVADDGERVFSFRTMPGTTGDPDAANLADDPVMILPHDDDHPARLPPGRYYVAPGWFLYAEDQVDLIRLVRSRKAADLGLFVSVVVADGGCQAKVDLFEAQESIRHAMRGTEP